MCSFVHEINVSRALGFLTLCSTTLIRDSRDNSLAMVLSFFWLANLEYLHIGYFQWCMTKEEGWTNCSVASVWSSDGTFTYARLTIRTVAWCATPLPTTLGHNKTASAVLLLLSRILPSPPQRPPYGRRAERLISRLGLSCPAVGGGRIGASRHRHAREWCGHVADVSLELNLEREG